MNFNWHSIVAVNNSQQEGFEELVCQLASQQNIKDAVSFRRVGRPDAGKECFWELRNRDLIVWQAKFFTSSPTIGQWAQIDESVKDCIDNHAGVKKIIVALPYDLPDARLKGTTSALEKWNKKVQQWKAIPKAKKQKIVFEYWGSSELIALISKNSNEGLKQFFFNSQEFSDEWFDAKNEESQTSLGSRYTKEFTVDLPIAKVFSALARDEAFQSTVYDQYEAYLKKFRDVHVNDKKKVLATDWKLVDQANNKFRNLFEAVGWISNEPIPTTTLKNALSELLAGANKLLNTYYTLRIEEEQASGEQKEHYNRPYANEIASTRELISEIEEFQYFLEGWTFDLANNPFLLLQGDAGTGKSHLLADVVKNRRMNDQISLHLLGENFSTKEPAWVQMLNNQVRKNIDEFTFLGVLNAKAQIVQSRIIIFIDAINEGEGRTIWPKKLKPFINTIKKYKWLGLVVSVRSSFVPLIAPDEDFKEDDITRLEHEGFKGLEHQAAVSFFQHYGIELPDAPMLNPEFQNPLFLKLFCESLTKRGLRKVPEGYEGLTTIFKGFIDSVDKKLSQPTQLFYEEQKKLVFASVKLVVEKLVEKNQSSLDFNEADQLVDSVFNGHCTNKEPFLRRLISEGIFNEDLQWQDLGTYQAVISFSYQRFQDHLVIQSLLDKELDVQDPVKSFQTGQLGGLLHNESNAYYNMNLLEALSIQLPERIGKELYEVAPHAKLFIPVADAFINSLIWRKSSTFQEGAKQFTSQVIFPNQPLRHKFLDVSISLSTRPGYFFNADMIHRMLQPMELARRDKYWTIFIHNKFDEHSGNNAVKTLINWARADDDKSYLNDASVELALKMTAWFLTSSNRRLRDYATKALICLIQRRMHIATWFLREFNDVNDPYVAERIYAVVYGAAVRQNSANHLLDISVVVKEVVFDKPEVYPHILLRDYARGIIEFAVFKGVTLPFDIATVRPPYRSKPIPEKLPTKAEIERDYRPKKKSGDHGNEKWGITAILESMNPGPGLGGYGDFGHYIFARALDDFGVDYQALSRYAIQRIFEMGYEADKFTQFDLKQGSGRSGSTTERIGKKYQWIVFHEILARVADTQPLEDESIFEGDKSIQYDGTWYPRVRDIDPTMIIVETGKQKRSQAGNKDWWTIPEFKNYSGTEKEWIARQNDLPSLPKLIEVVDNSGVSWVYLEIHPDWTEREKIGEDKWGYPRKRLWYQVRSVIVNKDDVKQFYLAFKDMFYRGAFPETRSLHEVFSREYYWSPAFHFFNKRYYNGEDWVEVYDSMRRQNLIGLVMRTTEQLNWEEEFDESKESTISFYKPSAFLNENLKMTFSLKEGELVDKAHNLICFDPSVNNPAVSGLLIRKDALVEFLNKNNLRILWNVVGEKQIIGNSRNGDYPGRLNLCGLYDLKNGKVTGKLKFDLEGTGRRRKSRVIKTVVVKSDAAKKKIAADKVKTRTPTKPVKKPKKKDTSEIDKKTSAAKRRKISRKNK